MSHALNIHDGLGLIAQDPGIGIMLAYGSTVPANATPGYAPGCKFFKTNATTKATYWYVNAGTKLSATFLPIDIPYAAPTPAIAAARVLTAADSGGVFSVAKTSAYAITLPTPAQGLKFRFMVLDAGANAVTISSGAATLFGVADVAGTPVIMGTGANGTTTLTLVATGGIGDWVSFEAIDATHYLVTGACVTAAKITVA